MSKKNQKESAFDSRVEKESSFYRIQFRREGQHFTAASRISGLSPGMVVMVVTGHGSEPSRIVGNAPIGGCRGEIEHRSTFEIRRQANGDEKERFENLARYEERAFSICNSLIEKHQLSMQLVRVERFFNGSKIIFFFTADNRVDFRALVKDLVQEFRTRVEMRQVGVRHETKMIGGVGTCGRELCCSSFIKKFDSVSIKMAKEQDLPLNPSKISGVCNRLLCCLTYEYDTYKKQRKGMPRPGKRIRIGDEVFRVKRQNPLQESILAANDNGEEKILTKDKWKTYKSMKKKTSLKKRGEVQSPVREKKKSD